MHRLIFITLFIIFFVNVSYAGGNSASSNKNDSGIYYGNDSISINKDKNDVKFYEKEYDWILPRRPENQKDFEGMPERMQLWLNPGRVKDPLEKEWRIYWYKQWKCGAFYENDYSKA